MLVARTVGATCRTGTTSAVGPTRAVRATRPGRASPAPRSLTGASAGPAVVTSSLRTPLPPCRTIVRCADGALAALVSRPLRAAGPAVPPGAHAAGLVRTCGPSRSTRSGTCAPVAVVALRTAVAPRTRLGATATLIVPTTAVPPGARLGAAPALIVPSTAVPPRSRLRAAATLVAVRAPVAPGPRLGATVTVVAPATGGLLAGTGRASPGPVGRPRGAPGGPVAATSAAAARSTVTGRAAAASGSCHVSCTPRESRRCSAAWERQRERGPEP